MTRQPDRAVDPLPGEAGLIELSRDPIALVDNDGALSAVNAPFREAFRDISGFLRFGTPWNVLLSEVERHGILSGQTCQALAIMAEHFGDSVVPAPALDDVLSGTKRVNVRLVRLLETGFALTILPADQETENGEREIEDLMAKVLDACPTSLVMSRIGDGQILYRSPAAIELLGKGRSSHDHFAEKIDRADFITALLPNARVDDMRITGIRADGTEFPAAISARVIDYRNEEVVVSSMVDLSDEIAMREELARRKDQIFLAEKMSALGELLAGVAHELNNPLSIVVGNAHMLLEEDDDPSRLRRIGKLNDAAERCVRIVRTFLSMARDRSLELTTISVGSVVSAAVNAYRDGGQTANVEIEVLLDPKLPDLRIDETQTVQVLTNLLINADHAIGATRQDGRILVAAQASGKPGFAAITVADNGPGVPPDIASRIYDPLFTTKSEGQGTGVGLALCQRIVTAHGGTITLDQAHAPGARFVVHLPLASPDQNAEDRTVRSEGRQSEWAGTRAPRKSTGSQAKRSR